MRIVQILSQSFILCRLIPSASLQTFAVSRSRPDRLTRSTKFSLRLCAKHVPQLRARKKSRQPACTHHQLPKLTSCRVRHSSAKPVIFLKIAKLFGKFAKIPSRGVLLEFTRLPTQREGTKNTKNKLKKINHKGHKELKGRKAREIKFLRPLPFDFAHGGELVEPCSSLLRHPTWDGYSRPIICDLCALCG